MELSAAFSYDFRVGAGASCRPILIEKGAIVPIELTEQQCLALAGAGESPPRIIDPQTRQAYVLIREEVFACLRESREQEFDPRETYPFVDRVMAEDDLHDPHLADYQHLSRERPS